MAARMYTLALTGVAQRLSNVLTDPTPGGIDDEAMVQIILAQDPANAAAIYIGNDSTVSSSVFGFSLDPTQATAQDRQSIGPFAKGCVKLSELWAIGTNTEKLHIFAVPH